MTSRSGERWTAGGAVVAGLAVLAGAFGAHLLGTRISEVGLGIWETAARYQMYHGLALIVTGHRLARRPSQLLRNACRLFGAGTLLFCGSLYALALTDSATLGAITPLGGVALVAGWGCLALGVLRQAPPAS